MAGSTPLIIAGMHRSGTTLTARWLQNCGLYVGARFHQIKYSHSTPGGMHYEDADFLDFHVTILKKNGFNSKGYLRHETLITDAQDRINAEALIAARSHHPQWGWKDPRTCLFLDLWMSVLPQAKLLIVYRHYEEVVDSLLRRKLDHPKPLTRVMARLRFFPLHRQMEFFTQVWTRYNRELGDVVPQFGNSALVIRIDDVRLQSDRIVAFMNRDWGFQLAQTNLTKIYEKERMRKESRFFNRQDPRIQTTVQGAEALYQQLEVLREASLKRL